MNNDPRNSAVSQKVAANVIALAEQHIGQGRRPLSVRECLTDAMTWFEQGEYGYAAARGLKSLRYSVGEQHATYKQAAQLIG